MKVIRLERWADFVDLTSAQAGWAFRGETSAQWPLVSSLTRRLQTYCDDKSLWPLREERALRIFRRKAHIHLADRSALDDDLRCLALMQHHGAPTRLLDFTKSPYVAAFFALEDATGDAAVYALNTPVLWTATPAFDPTLTRERIDPRVAGNYARYFLGNRWPVLWCGEPSEMDRRLVAQSGLFVVPGVLDEPLERILQHYGRTDELIVKIVLPFAMRAQAMSALYRMNVTNASLFPDLEGLARATAYELEVVWERLIDEYRARQGALDAPAAPQR
ncbi:FRG domain-containing protein [Azohydromonas sediminis]|uniref:FRG domain-containing protein n=1 Tax=Azohydromonas sediminis TaxID=2259674 RepID=UPI000E656D25|nr:FRG domain-containing protein [Azohydromonas sediminis]